MSGLEALHYHIFNHMRNNPVSNSKGFITVISESCNSSSNVEHLLQYPFNAIKATNELPRLTLYALCKAEISIPFVALVNFCWRCQRQSKSYSNQCQPLD